MLVQPARTVNELRQICVCVMEYMVDGILMCDNSKPKEEEEEALPVDEISDEVSSAADVCDPEKYQEVFQTRHKLSKLTRVSDKIIVCCILPY